VTEPAAGAAEITVMVVDDHAVVRKGVQAYLESQPELKVVGEAQDGRQALAVLQRLRNTASLPDVVLMDVVMPEMDGVNAAERIAALYPAVRVVILTSFGELSRVRKAIEVGVVGYLLKDAAPDEIVAAIRAAAKGEMYLDGAVTRRLTRQMLVPSDSLMSLSARERDILVLVAAGKSNRQIAEELTISERTARTHVSNILAKLNLRSRTQAALLAIQQGIAPLPMT
jgi:DNA-binding NarL/FixJ family response regulator